MIFQLYAIRDKYNGFGQIEIDANEFTARRNFAFALQSGLMKFAAADYDLYRVGTYDASSGCIKAEVAPVFICTAADIINMYKE